jgi:predicted esterase
VTEVIAVRTETHGRVLVDRAEGAPAGTLVAFHGYGLNAQEILESVRAIPGVAHWHRVAIQALHRFYARDHQTVVASWMTREDRDLAIADNIAYVDRALDDVAARPGIDGLPRPLVFLGFSQGTAMAYRAALRGSRRADGVIALGGDVPPELAAAGLPPWPPVLVGAGSADVFYPAARVAADAAVLAVHAVRHEIVGYEGGHEWTGAFCQAAARWLAEVANS